ncbi:hypothetical protein EXIGLDRAFT_506055 [Exidia glandulosa HHB12029]|uniref:Uncharacterized protein n=1 Tax=Exidia glandulosa HHB12029 TaxID=1314781 RepID=A0A166AS01_EXIGL|nr:hypothetical protein EXIGLDRAFT_506055 [Exidia glandulosa HHB12029]
MFHMRPGRCTRLLPTTHRPMSRTNRPAHARSSRALSACGHRRDLPNGRRRRHLTQVRRSAYADLQDHHARVRSHVECAHRVPIPRPKRSLDRKARLTLVHARVGKPRCTYRSFACAT